jgi:hypothetical protein
MGISLSNALFCFSCDQVFDSSIIAASHQISAIRKITNEIDSVPRPPAVNYDEVESQVFERAKKPDKPKLAIKKKQVNLSEILEKEAKEKADIEKKERQKHAKIKQDLIEVEKLKKTQSALTIRAEQECKEHAIKVQTEKEQFEIVEKERMEIEKRKREQEEVIQKLRNEKAIILNELKNSQEKITEITNDGQKLKEIMQMESATLERESFNLKTMVKDKKNEGNKYDTPSPIKERTTMSTYHVVLPDYQSPTFGDNSLDCNSQDLVN